MVLVNKNILLVLGVLVALFLPPFVGFVGGMILFFNRELRGIGSFIAVLSLFMLAVNLFEFLK